MIDKAKRWCERKGYEFIKLSPDGKRVIFYEPSQAGDNYELSVINIEAVQE